MCAFSAVLVIILVTSFTGIDRQQSALTEAIVVLQFCAPFWYVRKQRQKHIKAVARELSGIKEAKNAPGPEGVKRTASSSCFRSKIRIPRRRQRFASFHDVDGEHFCGPVSDQYFVYGARENMPGFARADELVRFAPFQDRKTAFQQISGIETRMRMQSGIYVWRHLDKHHHRFVATVRHIEFFHDGARN